MKFYISDTHFKHKNIIRLDQRPWASLDDMQDDMIVRWNNKVTKSDDVYIIGDFCWGTVDDWKKLLPKLHGKKHLIKGNHDLRHMPADIIRCFESVSTYKEVIDGNYTVIMSHYPMPIYRHDSDPSMIMLYGHVHNTSEFDVMKAIVKNIKDFYSKTSYNYQGNLYNCWCGFLDYAPATLSEIMNNSQTH